MDAILNATTRKVTGRKVKTLRKEGLVPGNVYGKAVASEAVQVKEKDFRDDKKEALGVLIFVFQESLKLLHPFMPFITETIWQEGKDYFDSPLLITASWPTV